MSRPLPVLARRTLERFLPPDWREDILRDLEEGFNARVERRGHLRARLWLWSQVPVFSARFGAEAVRELAQGALFGPTDLKLALRALRRTPWIAALAVVSLSIGIGSTAGAFVVIRGAFFTDLPFPDGDRIMVVQDYNLSRRYAVDISGEEFQRRRGSLRSFDRYEAHYGRLVVVGEAEAGGRSAEAVYMTPGLLEMTGVSPFMGRLPDANDVRDGAEPVVVLPHGFWRSELGEDPGVIGSTLVVDGVQRTVVGVMPDGFGFPWGPRIWIPMDAEQAARPLRVIARLAPGSGRSTAIAELGTVARRDPTQMDDADELTFVVSPLQRPVVTEGATLLLYTPLLAFLLLLVVMATNVANLMLAKNAARSSEIAVRSALGAGRSRIVGQLLLESLVLAGVASVLGLGVARWGVDRFAMTVGDLPAWADFSFGWPVVLFTGLVGLVAAALAGLAPALRATGGRLADTLKSSSAGAGVARFGRTTGLLVVVELTVCVAFLSSAALLGQSLLSFGYAQYDLPADETLVAQLYFGWPEELRDPDAEYSPEQRERIRLDFMAEATRKRGEIEAAALEFPGVRSAAFATRMPGGESETDRVVLGDGTVTRSEIASVGAGYFELMGAEIVRGRDFTDGEYLDGSVRVAIVNEPFVRQHFGAADPLGALIRVGAAADDETAPPLEIVGVVPDLGLNPGNPANADGVYVPVPDVNFGFLAIRGEGDPRTWIPSVVGTAQRIDPEIQVQQIRTMEAQMNQPVALFRGLGVGFLVLGGLSLLLSAAGVHALTSASVSRRTREFGIRQALGAGRGRMVGTVLRRVLVQLAISAVLGGAVTVGLLRLASVFPWEVRDGNPAALALVVSVLFGATLLAVVHPLRRALSVRPAEALRSE